MNSFQNKQNPILFLTFNQDQGLIIFQKIKILAKKIALLVDLRMVLKYSIVIHAKKRLLEVS